MIAVLLYGLTAPPILLLIAAFLHRECRLYRAVVEHEERMDREFFEGRWDWDFDADLAAPTIKSARGVAAPGRATTNRGS